MTFPELEDMLLADDEGDLDELDLYVSLEGPDYDRPVGTCAYCADVIFRGQGGPLVHDFCSSAFVEALESQRGY